MGLYIAPALLLLNRRIPFYPPRSALLDVAHNFGRCSAA
jgi:hypothetical protein